MPREALLQAVMQAEAERCRRQQAQAMSTSTPCLPSIVEQLRNFYAHDPRSTGRTPTALLSIIAWFKPLTSPGL